MAFDTNVGLDLSLNATEDLSAKQFFFVALDDGKVAAVADVALPLQNKPDASGKTAALRYGGISKVVAGAAIAVGAKVAPDAAGKGRTAVSTDHPTCIALEAAGSDLDVIACLVLPTLTPLV
jgi:hypothetical protein